MFKLALRYARYALSALATIGFVAGMLTSRTAGR